MCVTHRVFPAEEGPSSSAYLGMGCPTIPQGMTIDRLCGGRNCVNPEQLEALTQGENTRRGETTATKNAVKTHCSQDHPYDEVNTIKYRDRRGSMTRLRRTCIHEPNRSRRARRRAEEQAQ
jgi:hypothetical protein